MICIFAEGGPRIDFILYLQRLTKALERLTFFFFFVHLFYSQNTLYMRRGRYIQEKQTKTVLIILDSLLPVSCQQPPTTSATGTMVQHLEGAHISCGPPYFDMFTWTNNQHPLFNLPTPPPSSYCSPPPCDRKFELDRHATQVMASFFSKPEAHRQIRFVHNQGQPPSKRRRISAAYVDSFIGRFAS